MTLDNGLDVAYKSMEEPAFLETIRAACKSKVGRSLVWEVLGLCDIYSVTNRSELDMAYQNGKRAVGLDILSWLNEADPTLYIRMQQEHIGEALND